MSFIYSLKKVDYIILGLFLLHTAPFLGLTINGGLICLISSSLLTLLYCFESHNTKRPLLQIIIVLGCLIINYLLNDCGLGALVGCWELFVILMLCPYLHLSRNLFKLLFWLCLCIFIAYISWLLSHPFLYSYGAKLNSNQVGLFAFYMASFLSLFCSSYTKLSIVFLLFIQILSFGFIGTAECRSAQLATLFPMFVLTLMLFSKTMMVNTSINVLRKIYPFFVWGGIIIVLFSFLDLSLLESYIGDFSNAVGNKKGSSLSLRGNIWKDSFEYFCESPFIGTGTHIKMKSFKSLALHSSAMNILVIFGCFVFFIIYTKIQMLLRDISNYLNDDIHVLLSFVVFIGVLITSYVESSLMDYYKFYSFLPLFYASSRINELENYQNISYYE